METKRETKKKSTLVIVGENREIRKIKLGEMTARNIVALRDAIQKANEKWTVATIVEDKEVTKEYNIFNE